MARKNGKRTDDKAARKAARKAALKKFAKDSARSTKIALHNGFIAFVFGFAMVLICVAAVELSYIIAGFSIGMATNGKTETVGDFVVVAIAVAMTCIFVSFFAKKFMNALITAMKKRFWHTDEITGEIDRGEIYNKKKALAAIADDNTNADPANDTGNPSTAGPRLAKRSKHK